jgi:hypothetical protein
MKPMKKMIFGVAVATFIAGTMLVGCQSRDKKVENAQEKVQNAEDKVAEARQELNQAIKDSIQQFKKDAAKQIEVYEKNMAELRIKIANERSENRAYHERKLAELEQQNREMRMRLENFNEDNRDQWVSFRNKFSHDMEEHGKAFRDFWAGKK